MRCSKSEAVLILSKWLHGSANLDSDPAGRHHDTIARDRSADTVLASSFLSITEVIR